MKYSVLVLILGFWGCYSTPKPQILKNSSLNYVAQSPIKVYIFPEKDYAGYFEKLDYYDLVSIRDRLSKKMGEPSVIIFTGSYDLLNPPKEIPNLFEITQNKNQADILLEIIVDEFEYGDMRALGEKIRRYTLWEAWGLMPKGYGAILVADLKITGAKTGRILAGFEVVAVSEQGEVRRKSFDQAIENGTAEILDHIYEY